MHGAEIKQLVRVLRNDPYSAGDPGDAQTEKATVAAIKQLPRRLRSSLISSHGSLCHTHKGLDTHLMDDVWGWIKFELEVAVGRFLYPMIMSGTLTEADELQVRQLEPVVEMFLLGWTLSESAPPGKTPIDTGAKWAYQQNGCPACMLSRIGSDADVLFALFVGMCGHLRSRSGGQKGVEKVRSKRLRFVRYWMRTHTKGDQAAREAYDFGKELKAVRHDAKASLRRVGQSTRFRRHDLDGHVDAAVDLSDPYNPKDWTMKDPKIGPEPPLNPLTQMIIDSWETSTSSSKSSTGNQRTSINFQPPTPHTHKFTNSIPSTHTVDDDTLAPLPTLTRANLKRHDSVHSTSTSTSTQPTRPTSSIYSRRTFTTSIASFNAPDTVSDYARGFDPLETTEERVDRYRRLLAPLPYDTTTNVSKGKATVPFGGRLLPKPSRTSMYSAFGEDGRSGEEFDIVDVTPPPSPGVEGGDHVGEGLVPHALAPVKA